MSARDRANLMYRSVYVVMFWVIGRIKSISNVLIVCWILHLHTCDNCGFVSFFSIDESNNVQLLT